MKSFFDLKVEMTPGKVLRAFRTNFGLTLEQLSSVTGIERTNLSALENERREIGLEVAVKLGAAFGIGPEYILFPRGYRRPTFEREVREIEERARALHLKQASA